MDYVQALKRGDIARAADLSFACIRCGLCALRCPAEIVQYNAATLAQRLYARYVAPKHEQLEKRVREVENGEYDKEFDEMKKMPRKKLAEKYYSRELKVK